MYLTSKKQCEQKKMKKFYRFFSKRQASNKKISLKISIKPIFNNCLDAPPFLILTELKSNYWAILSVFLERMNQGLRGALPRFSI